MAATRATTACLAFSAQRALPTVERLSEYRATVLVDVEARSLSPDQLRAISEATKELGRGLVVIGGEHAYALGGYGGTPLEDLLPVASEVTDPLKRKSVAQVLAIDTSGSMGACHCAGGQGFGGRLQGGVNKTEIARTAAARAIATMAKDDQIGVLAFNTRQRWAIDMQTVPAADIVQRGLAGLTARGNTNLTTPLLVAGDKLRNTKANLKHIVLFTDGFTSQDALAGLASQAQSLHDEGITVSVVATGEGAAQELSAVAAAGHGRFYPGTDLLEIPEIIVQETVLASRTFINEGEFRPVVTGTAAPVRGLDASPALLGYVATTAKATSEPWLRIGGQRDPLLSSWRVGLGRVTAWTSDASERWSQRWASWDGYSAFWAGIIKHTFPGEEGAVVRTEVRGDKLLIKVEGDGAWPDGATGSLQLAGPDGVSRRVPLDRTGSDTLSAALDAPVAGTYAVGADIRKSDGSSLARASGLATRSYAAEYLPGAADRKTMQAISAITRGRGDIESAAAFDPTGLRGGSAKRALRNWLLLLAALLWPIDIALRRLTRRRAGAAHAARAGTLATRLRGVSAAVRSKLSIDGAPPLGASGGRGSAPAGRSAPSAAPAGGPAARIGPRTAPLSAVRIGPRTAPLSAPTGSGTGSPNGSGANGDTRPATDLVTIGPSPGRTGPAGGTSAVAVAERPASKSANLERMLAAKRARAAKSAPETGDASKAGIPGEGDKASGAH